MKKYDICQIVTNEVANDPRVDKMAKVLSTRYAVCVLGLGKCEEGRATKDYDLILVGKPSIGITVERKDIIKKNIRRNKNCVSYVILDAINYAGKLKYWKKMKEALDEIDAKIYVANDLDTLPFVARIAKKKKAKLIYDAHEFYVESDVAHTQMYKVILRAYERRYISYADVVVTINPSISEKLADIYKLEKKPEVIYNIPKTNLFSTSTTSTKNGIVSLVYSGRFVKDRGLPELVLAMEHLSNKFVLYLQGYGPLEPELKGLVDSHKLNQKVIFVEPVQMHDTVDSLRSYDIGVIPYQPVNVNNYLCTPNKIFEYMQAGLVIVCSDLPELKRIIKESPKNGEVFDPYNPEDIAKKIVCVSTKLKNLKQNSIEKSQKYTWANEEEKLFKIYEGVICSEK
jgi:glycosyltransferase involved in cell wall biosynthesis